MCGLKCSIRVVAIALMIQSGHLISTGRNGTAEILWNLSHLAIQGRRVENPSQFQLHPEKFAEYTGPVKPRKRYGYAQNYPRPYPPYQPHPLPASGPYPQYQHHHPPPSVPYPPYQPHPLPPGPYRPNPMYPPGLPVPIPALPPGYQRYPQSFMDALASIAQNDEFRCIPRLLCELTSGQNQQSILPFNIDMDSLVRILSGVTGAESSPLLTFGKAILLGYSAKGQTGSCGYAYPQCPQDPDRLVEYLNNHNGGFFRFFHGAPGFPHNSQRPFFSPQQPYPFQFPQIPQHFPQKYPPHQLYPQQYPQRYPPHYFRRPPRYPQSLNEVDAEKRIQNQPMQYIPGVSGVRGVPGVRFPNHFLNDVRNEVSQEDLFSFPSRVRFNDGEQIKEHSERRQKAVAFPVNNDFQKPLSKLKPGMIFPDRTGTGELRLDTDELANPKYAYSYLAQVNRGAYYRRLKEGNIGSYNFGNGNPLVKFPLRDQDI